MPPEKNCPTDTVARRSPSRIWCILAIAVANRLSHKLDVAGGIRFDSRSFNNFALYTQPDPVTGFDKAVSGNDTAGADHQFSAFHKNFSGLSGSLGATYNFSEHFSVKANLARGFRAPNISEISANGVHPGTGIYQLGNPDFNTRIARTRNRHRLIAELNARTSRFSKAQLIERLAGRIPFGPVMDIAEIMADPHFAARKMIVDVEQPGAAPIQIAGVPIKMTETPGGVMRRSPYLGEDSDIQLRKLGLSNEEIAGQLFISPATAKTHVNRAMMKVGARDRAQLVVFAYEAGLDAYIAGDWMAAQRRFQEAAVLRSGDKAAKLMMDRCLRYRLHPPSDWDGVSG